jgi:hypothetical protein
MSIVLIRKNTSSKLNPNTKLVHVALVITIVAIQSFLMAMRIVYYNAMQGTLECIKFQAFMGTEL